MHRIAVLGAVLAFALLPSTAAAATSTGVEPVDWTISSDACQFLPAGTTVTGSGTLRSTTVEQSRPDGSTAVRVVATATGSATDDSGGSYVWHYINVLAVTDSADDPGVFTGRMIDRFTLSGSGAADLSNGFHARITTDFADVFEFDVIRTFGDPIDFATGEAQCDPL